MTQYPQDVSKAKQLLAAAGWQAGAGGTLTKNGATFKFTMLIQSQATDSDPVDLAAAIQQAWQAVGVDVQIQQLDRASLEQRIDPPAHQYDAYLWWDGYNFDPNITTNWHSGTNGNGWANPQLDTLIDSANHATSQAARKAALDQISEMVANQVYFIPLYYYSGFVAVRDCVGRIPEPSAADFNNSAILYQVQNLTSSCQHQAVPKSRGGATAARPAEGEGVACGPSSSGARL